MNTFLVILLIAAMIATLVALVRGVVTFLQDQSAQVKDGGPSAASLRKSGDAPRPDAARTRSRDAGRRLLRHRARRVV